MIRKFRDLIHNLFLRQTHLLKRSLNYLSRGKKVNQQHIGPFFLDEDLWYIGIEIIRILGKGEINRVVDAAGMRDKRR